MGVAAPILPDTFSSPPLLLCVTPPAVLHRPVLLLPFHRKRSGHSYKSVLFHRGGRCGDRAGVVVEPVGEAGAGGGGGGGGGAGEGAGV